MHERGSATFNEAFDLTAKLFPHEMTANINAATMEIERGNLNAAYNYLQRYQDQPEAWNVLGVLYMLQKRYDDAEVYLWKALSVGNEDAHENLFVLRSLKR